MTDSTNDNMSDTSPRMVLHPPDNARRGVITRAVGMLVVFALTSSCSNKKEEPAGEKAAGAVPITEAGEAKVAGAKGESAATGEKGEASEKAEKAPSNRVTLGEEAARTARILVETPHRESVSSAEGGLDVPGQIEFDPARVAVISPRTSGRLERLLVVPGDRVSAGQTVALVQSPTFSTAQNDLLQATRRLELLRGTPDESGARALRDAARRRLALVGVGASAIDRLEAGTEPSALLAVSAPFSGSIIEAQALAGQAVEAGTSLFKLADLSAVNVAADVPERALRTVRVGQGASIRVAGAPQTVYAGRVTRVSDVLDSEKRTVKALITVSNSGRALKPGMFATVTLKSGGSATTQALTLPAESVVTDGESRYVFVEVAPRTYERRSVAIAPSAVVGGGPATSRVTIADGVALTDRVVVRGAFTLKSELGKASLKDED